MDENTLELLNSTHALIDKVEINGFEVLNIDDVVDLQRKGIVTTKENAVNYIPTQYGERYSSIKIRDTNLFNSFTYALTNSGCLNAELSISVTHDKYHNLNCFTAEMYREKLIEIQAFLMLQYGIKVDFSNAKYKSIEINKTIMLDSYFYEYNRVIPVVMFVLPPKLKLKQVNYFVEENRKSRKVSEWSNRIDTYYKRSGKKTGLEVKIYNKTKQLENKYHIKLRHHYLRYEITLISNGKIKRTLGTNEVQLLDDEILNQYFTNFIKENVQKAYLEYCSKCEKELIKILKMQYVPKGTKWVGDTLSKIQDAESDRKLPLLLDVEQLLPLLSNLPFQNRQSKSRAKKLFIDDCSKNRKGLVKGDDKKCEEMLQKLLEGSA